MKGSHEIVHLKYSAARVGEKTSCLTWGQRYIWDIIERLKPHEQHTNLIVAEEAPVGISVEDVCRALSILLEKTEALRTTYQLGSEANPIQLLSEVGELDLQVVRTKAADYEASIHDTIVSMLEERFDLAIGPPVKMAIVISEDGRNLVILTFSHLVCDYYGVQILKGHLRNLLTRSSEVSFSSWHPQDQSLWEQSEEGLKVEADCLEHWQKQLANFPKAMFYMQGVSSQVPRWWTGALCSNVLSTVLPKISARYRVSPASAVIATLSLFLAHKTGHDLCAVRLRVSNRTALSTRDSVNHFSQEVPLFLNIADKTFKEILQYTNETTLKMYRHGKGSPTKIRDEVLKCRNDTGKAVDLTCVFNVVSDIPNLQSITELDRSRIEEELSVSKFYWKSKHTEEFVSVLVDAVLPTEISLMADTSLISPSEIEMLLRGVERLLSIAAFEEPEHKAFLELSGVTRYERHPYWAQIGNSWVDLVLTAKEIARITRSECNVFAVGHRIIAYIFLNVLSDVDKVKICLSNFAHENPSILFPSEINMVSTLPKSGRSYEDWKNMPLIYSFKLGQNP